MPVLDAQTARSHEGGPSFSLSHRLYRAVWIVTWTLAASWTPPPLHRWRVFLLNLFGADVHPNCHVYGSARIWHPKFLCMESRASLGPRSNCYCIAQVTLGERAIISQAATLCTGSHDVTDRQFQLTASPIVVEADAWVAAEAFVGPGVTVRQGAVLGARGVAFKDLEPWMIYVGNPCLILKPRLIRN
jgi:putative colanic acid biosynthesis acetyltransferase WcaF